MTDNRLLYLLVEALRQWLCPACGGKKIYIHRGWRGGTFVNEEVPCRKCNGTGLHPIAADALQAVGEKL